MEEAFLGSIPVVQRTKGSGCVCTTNTPHWKVFSFVPSPRACVVSWRNFWYVIMECGVLF